MSAVFPDCCLLCNGPAAVGVNNATEQMAIETKKRNIVSDVYKRSENDCSSAFQGAGHASFNI